MGATSTLAVNNLVPTAITATVITKRIIIREDPSVVNWPTTDYLVSKPLAASPQIRIVMGEKYQFSNENYYQPGEIAGYLLTVAGATTFQQDEEGIK
jgi:hypothetical protein